jgi:hypothetical protein
MSNRQTKRLKSRVNMLSKRNSKGINGLERRPGVRPMRLVTNCSAISAYEKVALFNIEKPDIKKDISPLAWMYL